MQSQNDKITVAAAQLCPVYFNKHKTVEKACKYIAEAGKKGARLIVFPEAFISGYPDWVWVVPNSKSPILNDLYVELVNSAVSIPDESTDQLCKAAKEANINVIMGLNERNTESSQSSLYNTLLFINHKGKILGKRQKLMPTGGERLVWTSGDGSTFQNFNLDIGTVGGLICWENYMPLARQAMYAMGTQILAMPTWDKSEKWLQSLQHIAREGGVFVIGCCSAIKMHDLPAKYELSDYYPADREWINGGNSCIINPMGEYINGPLGQKEDLLYAELDFSLITASKRMLDVAGHYARPDVFDLTINKKHNSNLNISE